MGAIDRLIELQVQVCKIFWDQLVGLFLIWLRGVLDSRVVEGVLVRASQDNIGVVDEIPQGVIFLVG